MKKSMPERFWSHVAIAGPDDCWLWTRSRFPSGYGQFRVAVGQSPDRASRVAYRLTYGQIPPGLLVRHSCDNPPCCNPAHLLVGTHKDNSDDMVARNRQKFDDPESVAALIEVVRSLSDEQIVEARRRNAAGESCRSIARDFGVWGPTISRLIKGESWKDYLIDA